MRSKLFEVHVGGILGAVDKALPELRKQYGGELSLKEIVETIGHPRLLEESRLSSIRATCDSIRGNKYDGPWLDIHSLYEESLILKENPPYLGEGI